MHTAQLGDRVRIQYSRLPQRAAASGVSRGQKTIEFTVGGPEVFPTLSTGVVGMAPGDRKQFTLQPQEAFGSRKPKLIREIPRQRIPERLTLEVGKRLTMVHGLAGRRRRVTVLEIKPDSVLLDANHPLAGKVVELEVSLLSVDSSSNANKEKPQFDTGGRG